MSFKCVFIFLILLGTIEAQTLWKQVTVDDIYFQGNPYITTTAAASSVQWQCGVQCDQSSTCKAWCQDGETCYLTPFLLSPLHVATNTGATKTCYTRLEKDFIVGSSVTFSPILASVLSRTPLNLVKGIFNGEHITTCAGTDNYLLNPWMLFDLGEVKPIREVRIMTQTFVYAPELLVNVEVKIGNSPPATSGDFSAFRLFRKHYQMSLK